MNGRFAHRGSAAAATGGPDAALADALLDVQGPANLAAWLAANS